MEPALVSRSEAGSFGEYSGFMKMDMPRSAYLARCSSGMLGMDSSLMNACSDIEKGVHAEP